MTLVFAANNNTKDIDKDHFHFFDNNEIGIELLIDQGCEDDVLDSEKCNKP